MATPPIMLLAERARQDSLFKRLERAGLLADFFSWFFSGRRQPEDCLAWLGEREVRSSESAVGEMIRRHGLAWRAAMAKEASDAQVGMLPADVEERTRRAIQAQTFDLALSTLGTKEVLFLEKMRRSDLLEQLKLKTRRQEASVRTRLKRRDQALAERKVRLLETRENQAKQTLGEAALSPAEKERKLREIFGLTT